MVAAWQCFITVRFGLVLGIDCIIAFTLMTMRREQSFELPSPVSEGDYMPCLLVAMVVVVLPRTLSFFLQM